MNKIILLKYFFIANSLLVLFSSCASTGNLNVTDEGIIAIESVGQLDYREAFLERELFAAKNIGGIYWKNPNEIIASGLQKNAEESKSFSSKNSLFLFLKDNYNLVFSPSRKSYENFILMTGNVEQSGDLDVNLYFYCIKKINKKNYSLCSYYVFINYEKVMHYDELTAKYQSYKKIISSNNKLIENYYTEYFEKSRKVPYTAYRTVQKSKPVTYYRTVLDGYGNLYQEPYTVYEYYDVQEAYTAYKTEYYDAPNPNYNPKKAANLEIENNKLNAECSSLADRINGDECDFYKIYYN